MVRRPSGDGGSLPCCSWSSHTRDLDVGLLVAAVADTLGYRVIARTGWPGVSML